MRFDIKHEDRTTIAATYSELIALGYPAAVAGAALKQSAKGKVAEYADQYRADLASSSAGKLAEYRFKEEIARDPVQADADELALIDREAIARGVSRADLLAEISAKASTYRQTALLIGVMVVEVGASISSVADDAADIEAQVGVILSAAKNQADAAFAAAQEMLAASD